MGSSDKSACWLCTSDDLSSVPRTQQPKGKAACTCNSSPPIDRWEACGTVAHAQGARETLLQNEMKAENQLLTPTQKSRPFQGHVFQLPSTTKQKYLDKSS